ncbi:MAG: pyruvate kinase [Gemmatimonadota bacterium]
MESGLLFPLHRPGDPAVSLRFRRAKIVSTIGPASLSPEVFRAVVAAGTDAVRINFSHASHAQATEIFSLARGEVQRTGRPLAVIADLQGPRIRVGDLPSPLTIRSGETYCLIPETDRSASQLPAERVIPTTYSGLAADLSPGDRVLLDDGRLELSVEEIRAQQVIVVAESDGQLTSQKGINLPGVDVQAPGLTEKDREDLRFAQGHDVEYVALSFVRRAEDVREAREILTGDTLLISKVEKDQALDRLSEILEPSHAVMVARGDLGVELPFEDVPLAQKRIIHQAVERARPVITATQMLDSMTSHARPTRAEVSDVANALLDGTDAVMLSGETAAGEFPVEAVEAMDRIIRRIEAEGRGLLARVARPSARRRAEIQQTTSGAVAAASVQAVERLNAPFICTFTRSGFTARVVSAQRPPVPILALSDQPGTFNQLALVWGVQPVLFRGEVGYESMLEYARKEALERGFGEAGEHFIVTAGVPFHQPGTTNMMRIEEL